MCLALPMQIQTVEPGYAWAQGRGGLRRIDLSLVGECAPGDYVLVFLDAARERIDELRAREIDQTLDLLDAALSGEPERAAAQASFALPSQLDAQAVTELTTATRTEDLSQGALSLMDRQTSQPPDCQDAVVLTVLNQLSDALDAALRDTASPAIALHTLPSASVTQLQQLLGEGEVSARAVTSDGAQLAIQESSLPGIWRVVLSEADGACIYDQLYVGALPAALLEVAHSDFAARGTELLHATGRYPQDVNIAPGLLAELRAHWRALTLSVPHIINLTSLPLTAADEAELERELGQGSVQILARGYGNSRVRSTLRPYTWRVQYYNTEDREILNTIEICDVPEIACAAPQDLKASVLRLSELVSWVTDTSEPPDAL